MVSVMKGVEWLVGGAAVAHGWNQGGLDKVTCNSDFAESANKSP